MKKLISYLITVMMVFTMIPYTAFAAGSDKQTSDSINLYIEEENPLFSDKEKTVTPVESVPLAIMDEEVSPNRSGYKDSVVTTEEAVKILRNGMVQRLHEISVSVIAEELTQEAVTKLADDIFYAAGEHTGVPVEGDSLRWVWASRGTSVSATQENNEVIVNLAYSVDYYTTNEQEQELTVAVDKLLDDITDSGMTDYVKIKAIYDYMTANILYDYDNLNDPYYTLKATAYAALINKTAVCQGYAVLFYRLALECGIDARVIAGFAGEGHAWNIVELEDKYYLVDATWDAAYAQAGASYSYFLLPSFSDHTADGEYLTDEFKAEYPMSDAKYTPAVCTEHIPEYTPAVEPTCIKAGYTEGSKCAICGKGLVAAEKIDALGHDKIFHEGQAATCTVPGWQAYETCKRCEYNTYKEIPVLKHKYGTEWVKDTNMHWHECECGAISGRATHDFVWIVDKAATCEETGIKHEECSVCGAVRNKNTIIDYAHYTNCYAGSEPTCTIDGEIEYYRCILCERLFLDKDGKAEITKKETVIPAPGHKYGAYVTTTKATFGKTGVQTSTCTGCNATKTRTIAAAKNPTLSATVYTFDNKVKKPAVTVKNGSGTKLAKTVTYAKGRKNVGTYKVTVKLTGSNYTGTKVVNFKINPKSTSISKLTKPGKKQIKVTWQKRTAQVTGYEIKYSTTKNFTKATTKTLKVKNFRTNTKTIKQLKAKKKYWVKVRTYKNVNGKLYYSTWSKAQTIITK